MSTTKITKERLAELEDLELRMRSLEAGGVDNWEFYGEALEQYNKDKELEDKLVDCFNEMLESLSSGAYEPSERGAGFAFNDDASDDAFAIFKKAVMER